MSRQHRIRVAGSATALLSGALAVAALAACGFEAPNLQNTTPLDASDLPDAPPDAALPPPLPCASLIKTCVSPTVLRECKVIQQPPIDTTCDWDCFDSPEPHCRAFTPTGNWVTAQDLDRAQAMAAGLQKRTFTAVTQPGSINTDTGQISIGIDTRSAGTGVRNGVDFKVVNGVGVFRFLELNLRGFQDVRVVGNNALALVAIDKITFGDSAALDLRGTCNGRTAGPGGKQGGSSDQTGTGTGAGGGGANNGGGACTGGGGAGYSRTGGSGGGAANAGGTTGTATITALVGGAGGGGGGAGGGDGGGGGGAIHLVSNGPIIFDAGSLQSVGINAGGCGGKANGSCGGGGGAGGAILVEGRTVDFSAGFLTVNGGGGAGASGGTSGEAAQTVNQANGGNGATPVGANNDGGDGGDGGDDGSTAQPGTVRDNHGGGGGGGVGWIRINTKSGATGGSPFLSPGLGMSTSTGTVKLD